MPGAVLKGREVVADDADNSVSGVRQAAEAEGGAASLGLRQLGVGFLREG